MADTLTLDAPGTIADAEQEASGASLVETSLPEAVETAGADAATETESAGERTPEEIKAELAELRKELKGADFRKEQALKDQRAQLERDLRIAAETQAHRVNLERAKAVAAGGFTAEMRKVLQVVERGEHLDENGQEKLMQLNDGTGRVLPYREAQLAWHVETLANSIGLRELSTLASLTPAQMKVELPDYKENTGLLAALDVAVRNNDMHGIWQSHFQIVKDGLLQDLNPKLRKQVEEELAANAAKDEAAGGVEKAAKAREAAPKPTNVSGGAITPLSLTPARLRAMSAKEVSDFMDLPGGEKEIDRVTQLIARGHGRS